MIFETYVFWHFEFVTMNNVVLVGLVFNWVLRLEFLVCVALMDLVRILVPGTYIDDAFRFNKIVNVIRH